MFPYWKITIDSCELSFARSRSSNARSHVVDEVDKLSCNYSVDKNDRCLGEERTTRNLSGRKTDRRIVIGSSEIGFGADSFGIQESLSPQMQ